MDGGAWWVTVHRVAKSQIQLSDFTFTFNPQLHRLSALRLAVDCFLEFSKTCDHIFFLNFLFFYIVVDFVIH